MEIRSRIKKFFTLRLFLGLLAGGILGFGYYYFIGCNSGGCALTSDPLKMTGYGMLAGALLFTK
jgi:hypothetical protein